MFEYQALQHWNNPCHTPMISSNELQQKDTYDINMLLNVYIVKSTYKFFESSIQLNSSWNWGHFKVSYICLKQIHLLIMMPKITMTCGNAFCSLLCISSVEIV